MASLAPLCIRHCAHARMFICYSYFLQFSSFYHHMHLIQFNVYFNHHFHIIMLSYIIRYPSHFRKCE